MTSLIILLRSETGFWLSAMGENWELGTSFRVFVVEERKESEWLGKMQLNGSFGEVLGCSVCLMGSMLLLSHGML